MPQRVRLTASLTLLSWLVCNSVQAENWARFRGPNGSGISEATNIPVTWTAADYNWSIDLPGSGISSPVVWNELVFVTSADATAGERYLLAINTQDGKTAWQAKFEFTKHPKHKNNTFATSTPAVDAEHVYVVWQGKDRSTLHAFTHAGAEAWQVDVGPFDGNHGPASSPIVYEDMVVFANDQEGESFLLAVDSKTGAQKWKVPRTNDRACYSTPCVFQPAGRPPELIFAHAYQGITGHDPVTGKKLWEVVPFGTFQQRAIGSPIVAGDLVIANSGFTTGERNLVAVRPAAPDGKQMAEEIYRISKYAPHIPTVLAYKNWLFLWDDRGIVACVESKTGEEVWVKRAGGNYYGSPVCVDGKLYCVDLDGNVVVLAASDKYEVLGKNELGKPSSATPAVADGVIYFRTDAGLISLGKK